LSTRPPHWKWCAEFLGWRVIANVWQRYIASFGQAEFSGCENLCSMMSPFPPIFSRSMPKTAGSGRGVGRNVLPLSLKLLLRVARWALRFSKREIPHTRQPKMATWKMPLETHAGWPDRGINRPEFRTSPRLRGS
jgi:hypothetical protein